MRQRFRKKSSRSLPVLSGVFYPLLGTALALPTAGVWLALVPVFTRLPREWTAWAPLAGGVVGYGLIHFAFRRPISLYVFGHELTHALAALVSGYKVKSLYVSEKGGEVQLSNTNVVVALAPYCLPIYTMIVVGLYLFVNRYAGFATPPVWFGAGVGATLAFHVALTVHALRQHQPDLHHAGVYFSLVAILFCNTLTVAALVSLLFPASLGWTDFALESVRRTRGLAEGLWAVSSAGGRRMLEWAREVR